MTPQPQPDLPDPIGDPAIPAPAEPGQPDIPAPAPTPGTRPQPPEMPLGVPPDRQIPEPPPEIPNDPGQPVDSPVLPPKMVFDRVSQLEPQGSR